MRYEERAEISPSVYTHTGRYSEISDQIRGGVLRVTQLVTQSRASLPLVSLHHQTSSPSLPSWLSSTLTFMVVSLLFYLFLLFGLADTTKTSTAPTTTTSPARLKLSRIYPSSTPTSQTTAKSPSAPPSQLNLCRNLRPSRNRSNNLQPFRNSNPLHHLLNRFLPINSRHPTTIRSQRLEPMTTRT